MKLDRRLAKLEDGLTPRQAMIRWLCELREFDSLAAYATHLLRQPAGTWPLERLTAQVSRGAATQMHSLTREARAKRVRDAETELVFLFLLHQELNLHVARELEILAKSVMEHFALLGQLTQLRLILEGLRRERLAWGRPELLIAEAEAVERYAQVAAQCRRGIATQGFARITILDGATRRLAQTYLRGHSLLLPDLRFGLALIRRTIAKQREAVTDETLEPEADAVARLLFEAMGPKQPVPEPDGVIHASGSICELDAEEIIAALTQHLSRRARALALNMLGDVAGSQASFARLLDELITRPGTSATERDTPSRSRSSVRQKCRNAAAVTESSLPGPRTPQSQVVIVEQGRSPRVDAHTETIFRMYLAGGSEREIASHVGLTSARIARLLTAARRTWQAARLAELDGAAKRIRELDRIKNAFTRAWKDRGLPGASDMHEGRAENGTPLAVAGDAYLEAMDLAARCLRRGARLPGSPDHQSHPSTDPYASLTPTEVEDELRRLAYGHGPAPASSPNDRYPKGFRPTG